MRLSESDIMHQCPICKVESKFAISRFICLECRDKTVDKKGRKIKFYNYHGEGYLAVCQETGEESTDHICFVSGVKCIADTHRLGGVEIQTYEGWLPYSKIQPINLSGKIPESKVKYPSRLPAKKSETAFLKLKRQLINFKSNKYTELAFIVIAFPVSIILLLWLTVA
jgi:hypothetical protein